MDNARRAIMVYVYNNNEKLAFLSGISQRLFYKCEKLLILTANSEVSEFVDNMLWKHPKVILPHTRDLKDLSVGIYISEVIESIDGISILFNLTKEPIIDDRMTLVYDFYDDRSREISDHKIGVYREKGFLIDHI